MELIKKYLIATALLSVVSSVGLTYAAAPEQNEEDTKEAFDATRYPRFLASLTQQAPMMCFSSCYAATEQKSTADSDNNDNKDFERAIEMSLQQSEPATAGSAEQGPIANSRSYYDEQKQLGEQLLHAIDSQNVVKVMQLIKRNAPINSQITEYGYTALTETARTGNLVMVHILLAAGAQIENDNNRDGNTPLMEAAMANQYVMVQYLLDAGANVNMQNWAGNTALTMMGQNAASDIVDILIFAGANRELKEKESAGVVSASSLSRGKTPKAMIENALKKRTQIIQAIKHHFVKNHLPPVLTDLVIAYEYDPNCPDMQDIRKWVINSKYPDMQEVRRLIANYVAEQQARQRANENTSDMEEVD